MSVNTEIRPVTDAELDEVNGGNFFVFALAAFGVGVGLGYATASGLSTYVTAADLARKAFGIN
jgi:hypothetical protein